MQDLEELRQILATQSIRHGTFTLTSGRTSHYYCDTKATVLSPRGAHLCGRGLLQWVEKYDAEAVGGLAMGATYLATAVAIASDEAEHPVYGFSVRPESKAHGTEARIDQSWHPDGKPLITEGRRVAVVDDVVTTAGSMLQAVEIVQREGCQVVLAAAIVDRRAGGRERLEALGLTYHALFEADEQGQLSLSG